MFNKPYPYKRLFDDISVDENDLNKLTDIALHHLLSKNLVYKANCLDILKNTSKTSMDDLVIKFDEWISANSHGTTTYGLSQQLINIILAEHQMINV